MLTKELHELLCLHRTLHHLVGDHAVEGEDWQDTITSAPYQWSADVNALPGGSVAVPSNEGPLVLRALVDEHELVWVGDESPNAIHEDRLKERVRLACLQGNFMPCMPESPERAADRRLRRLDS
jgi:hypothetical protein